jgi:site-specific DNA recombinase
MTTAVHPILPTALYLRISQDRAGLELGVERQREDCLALAERRGWPAPAFYVDNDISATSGKRRPDYERLIDDVRAGKVTRLIVWQTSRLWRNRIERAAGIEVLRAARVTLAAVKGPELDMATAAGRMLAGLLGEFDTAEVDVKSERAAREVEQRAEQGRHHGGPRAHGYTANGMDLVPDEAAAVERWYREILAGRSIASIAAEAGRNHSSIRVILANPRNAALRVLHGVEYPGSWPAIVPVETWRAVAALLDDPNRRNYHGSYARKWLGSGLYACERCGPGGRATIGSTYSGAANGGRRIYKCHTGRGGCSRSWDAEKLDSYIECVVAERLKLGDVRGLLRRDRPDLDVLRTERATKRRRLDQLAAEWAADDDADPAQLRIASSKLKARIAEIDELLVAAGTPGALAAILADEDPAAAWAALPGEQTDRRQAIVRGLMTITLGPSPRGRAPYRPEDFVRIDNPRRP